MRKFPIDDIRIYTAAKALNLAAYPHLARIRNFTFRDQMIRSALSIVSNVAEGYGRNTHGQFNQFLGFAIGSAFEFRAQLEIAIGNGLIDHPSGTELADMVEAWIPQALAFQRHLRS